MRNRARRPKSPGYSVIDFYAHWNVANHVRLKAGVTNLANRKYWAMGDVPLLASSAASLDRYTSPGRSLSAAVSFDW